MLGGITMFPEETFISGFGIIFFCMFALFITFELEGESRIEFSVIGKDFGLLMEGDIGKLKFQGTRYLGFERTL